MTRAFVLATAMALPALPLVDRAYAQEAPSP